MIIIQTFSKLFNFIIEIYVKESIILGRDNKKKSLDNLNIM